MNKVFISFIFLLLLNSCATKNNKHVCTEFLTYNWENISISPTSEAKLLDQLSIKINPRNIYWFKDGKNQLGLCSPTSNTVGVQAIYEFSGKNSWNLINEFIYTTTSGSIR